MRRQPLNRDDFVGWLRREGRSRYHDKHPFHVRMHAGQLSREELQRWVENRFCYQSRIPVKDALILSKSRDPAFRRMWLRRIVDHDGEREGEGGIAMWLRLAEAVGLDRGGVEREERVLPGVRFACDAYLALVRESALVEAVAASLTEFFSPDLMAARIEAWERHYAWIDPSKLDYFRSRVKRARQDSTEALAYVTEHATSYEMQAKCVAALIRKTEILWHLLDCVERDA